MRGLAVALLIAALTAAVPARAGGAVIDVRTFGAVPDDGGNDAPAINAAINSAAPGDVVFIPAGTWDVSQSIVARSGITIAGAHRDTSVIRYNGSSSGSFVSIRNVSSVHVAQLTLDGTNKTVGQGIYASSASGVTISDVAVKNLGGTSGFGPHGVHFGSSVTHSTIRDSAFTNIGPNSAWGAGVRVSHGSSFNQILNNVVATTGRGGILANDHSTDLLIKGNVVTGSGGTGLGIEIWNGSHRSIIEDNQIDHWLSVDASNFVAVRRNVVSDKSGVYKYAGLELVDSSDVIFTDNTVDGGQRLGISVSGPEPKERVVWAYNAVSGASTWGAQIQGEKGGANRHYFLANTFAGTLRDHPATLFRPQGHGVRLNDDVTNLVFLANEIVDNQGSGIQILGKKVSNLEFTANVIAGNSRWAVEAGVVPGLHWQENLVIGNGVNNHLFNARDGLDPEFDLAGTVVGAAQVRTVLVGEPVQFTIGAAEGAIEQVLWDFGEGVPTGQFSPTHVYRVPGDYRVTVIAWDFDGRGTHHATLLRVVPEPGTVAMIAVVGLTVAARRRRR